jgi:hypothetical protein
MIPKVIRSLLTVVVLRPILGIVCQAQRLPETRHLRNVVLNGEAKPVGRASRPSRLWGSCWSCRIAIRGR